MFTALFISGLPFGFLSGQQSPSEFNFRTSGLNDKFISDTINALDAASMLYFYREIDEVSRDMGENEAGEIFEDSRKGRRQRKEIKDLASHDPTSVTKMEDIDDRLQALYRENSDDADFHKWIVKFATEFHNRKRWNKDHMSDDFIKSLQSADSLDSIKGDVNKQIGIIDAYNEKYIEILKVLGCEGQVCKPRKKNKYDL